MTVMALYVQDQITWGDKKADLAESEIKDLLAECVLYNSSAHIELDDKGKQVVVGNVTEKGLFEYLMRSGANAFDLQAHRDVDGFEVLSIPFSSLRKRQLTAVRHPTEQGKVRVDLKGAPDMCIPLCTKILTTDGELELTEDKRADIINTSVVKQFADKTYRTLLVAYNDYDEATWEQLKAENNDFKEVEDREKLESDLTLVGIFGLVDPLRDGIKASVQLCQKAGITVRMCTGDHLDTAIAISKEAGIIPEDIEFDPENNEKTRYMCMTGLQFRTEVGGLKESREEPGKLVVGNKQKFRKIMDQLRVLARSSPEDKFLLVTGLKEHDHVVAVTGDGTNDAPALNKADVGFAMGITGTDVARNASDIILTDDNFCSIETAIKYGRNIYDNVRKFLQFQLTVNVAAMFIVFAGAVLFSDAPLTSVQMLWVNLIMDTFAALSLATEPPHDNLFDRQPASRKEAIVNRVMWRNIFGQGLMQIIVLIVMLFFGQEMFDLKYEDDTPFYVTEEWLAANPETTLALNDATNKCYLFTMIFQTFVFMQLFNQINARKLGEKEYNIFAGFFNNWIFIGITILTFAVQVIIVEYGGRALRSTPLTWNENLICLGIGAFSLIWGVIIKALIPAKLFACMEGVVKEDEMTEAEEAASTVASLRKSFRQSTMKRAPTNRSVKNLDM